MRIKIRTLVGAIIIIALLLDMSLLYLIDIPSFISSTLSMYNKCLIGIFAWGSFLFCLLNAQIKEKLYVFGKFNIRYTFLYIISILFVMTCTILKYNGGLKSAIFVGMTYFVMLLYVPILVYLQTNGNDYKLFRIINWIIFLWYILVILQALIYNLNGTMFLTIINESAVRTRENGFRCELLGLSNVMIIYNFYIVMQTKKGKWLNRINLILGLIALIYVQQTRVMTMIVGICILYILVLGKPIKYGYIKKILVCLCIGIIIFNTDIVQGMISSFSSVEYRGSTTARAYAISYFLSVFKDNPIYGFGFIAHMGNEVNTIYHGALGIAYVDDVGLIGQMAVMGIFVFIITIPLIIRMLYIIIKMKKYKFSDYTLYVCYLLYFILTFGTLSIYEPYRIILLPFLIALFEYAYFDAKITVNILNKN